MMILTEQMSLKEGTVKESKSPSRFVSIRVDEDLKANLEQIAFDSDRSITQLCKYAFSAFVLSGISVDDIVDDRDDSKLTQIIGIRLSSELVDEFTETTEDSSLSTTLRSILIWWIASADFASLGRPAGQETGGGNA